MHTAQNLLNPDRASLQNDFKSWVTPCVAAYLALPPPGVDLGINPYGYHDLTGLLQSGALTLQKKGGKATNY